MRAVNLRSARRLTVVGAALMLVGSLAITATGASASSVKYPEPKTGNGGKTAIGVTAKSIKLALLYSNSGPAAGALTGLRLGADAYAAYINSLGGVYGRKISVTPFDDGFNPVTAKALCTQITPGYFAITGGLSVGDSGCFTQVQSSGIPFLQAPYDSAQYSALSNYVFPGSGSTSQEDTAEYAAYHVLFPKVTKVAILYEDEPGNQELAAHAQVGVESAGFSVVLNEGVSLTSASYTDYVTQLVSSGAQAIFMDDASQVSQSALALAMAQQGYTPAFASGNTSYSNSWHTLAGAGAVNWTASLTSLPYLNATAMRATIGGKQFLTWFNRTNPGSPIDFYAVLGWEEADWTTQGIIAAGPKLTRTGVLSALKKITAFNGNGMYATAGAGKFSSCIIIVQATATSYKQLLPSKAGQFDCTVPGTKIIKTPGAPS
jgi:ABC-type branched-subunit amino acid transport system substrate-binding protein